MKASIQTALPSVWRMIACMMQKRYQRLGEAVVMYQQSMVLVSPDLEHFETCLLS